MCRRKLLNYEAVTAQNSQLKQELSRKTQSLRKISELQDGFVNQIGDLLKTYQTKSMCFLGHFRCNIDHRRYNYVKPSHVLNSKPSMKKNQISEPTKSSHINDPMCPSRLIRKINKLQCMYGLPSPMSEIPTTNLVPPEFTSIWVNVFAFNEHMSEISSQVVTPGMNTKSKINSSRTKFKNSSIILESRPLKIFKTPDTKKKEVIKSSIKYEPMNDAELATALGLDEAEIARAFGYDDEDTSIKAVYPVYDEEYEIDTEGLDLINDRELAASFGYVEDIDTSLDDRDLAAAHGYHDDSELDHRNEPQEPNEIADADQNQDSSADHDSSKGLSGGDLGERSSCSTNDDGDCSGTMNEGNVTGSMDEGDFSDTMDETDTSSSADDYEDSSSVCDDDDSSSMGESASSASS